MHSRLKIAPLLGLLAAAAMGQAPKPAATKMTIYKSPTCGCCSMWVEHMKKAGFATTVVDVDDIEVPMKTYGVPTAAASCHTAIVNGYVVEGHVPAETVNRMLREKPAIRGIAAPGMPIGSPGMEVPGTKAQPYDVVSFDKLGKTALYEKR